MVRIVRLNLGVGVAYKKLCQQLDILVVCNQTTRCQLHHHLETNSKLHAYELDRLTYALCQQLQRV